MDCYKDLSPSREALFAIRSLRPFVSVSGPALITNWRSIMRSILRPPLPCITSGSFFKKIGDYAKAEPLYQEALRIRQKVIGPENPSTALSLNNLAALYCNTGEYPIG
jgi:hypothetical protein